MKRRSFLGMLGLGGVAASVSHGVEVAPSYDGPYVIGSGGPTSLGYRPTADIIRDIKHDYDAMILGKEEWLAAHMEEMSNDYYHLQKSLPPDIEALKSFSGVAKRRLFIRRMAEKRYESAKSELWNRLQHYMHGGS